ncbi:MAG TPA: FAD-binding oxidoreductase, partial [Bacteroidetes bacterium]|nr:FAD-binding oxidoreductase [Bacteroidota bacterium]
GVPITARAAGTSLAGQTTGGGIVMDTSRFMNKILNIQADKSCATVQPGVIRDTLNREAGKFKLQFGPDTSTTSRCMLGGMIGNNSAGSFSLKHRTTREHTISIRPVLSDGSFATFGPLSNDELIQKKSLQNLEGKIYRDMLELLDSHQQLIRDSYPHPDITRRNTGYALDRLCEMEPFTSGGRPFNMAELLCGSEGTLAMTIDSVVRLVPVPDFKILLVGQYNSLHESMLATVEAVKHDTAAVELLDDIIIDATKLNIEQSRNRFFIVGEPKAVLIMQLEGDELSKLHQNALVLSDQLKLMGLGYDYKVITDADEMSRVWELRKAGLGLLMGTWAESRTPEFIEDTAVRVEDLPAYIEEFEAIMKSYGTHSVYYAHASVGELHLRPELNLTTREGLEKMKSMAVDVARLVKKYRGSLSGEHGDGRVRAPYIKYVLGEEMMPILARVKQIWDPKGIFNPGKIVDAKPMDADLRFYPEDKHPEFKTVFNYRAEGNFMALVDKCNGAGVCRKLAESGGTMCPSYMATFDEKDSTRGRANLFRQIFRGERMDAFSSTDLKKGLDLCLSCKACKSECPANVDMAKMKAEFTQGWHEKNGATLSEHFFARSEMIYPIAATFSRLTNAVNRTWIAKQTFKTLFKIHPKRNLPEFARVPFHKWIKKHPVKHPDGPNVIIMVDNFMNYNEPEIGIAMVHILQSLGYRVLATEPMKSGRTHLSKGFLKDAKKIAIQNVNKLSQYAKSGIPIIGQEPSEILTLRDEYLDLCEASQLDNAILLGRNSFMFEEFLAKHFENHPKDAELFKGNHKEVHLHGHCHAKSLVGIQPVLDVLSKAGFNPIDLKTGCCGMAGSFGYEKNHYETSLDVGELTLFPKLRAVEDDALICAHGFSCRHQIADGLSKKAKHTAVILFESMTN